MYVWFLPKAQRSYIFFFTLNQASRLQKSAAKLYEVSTGR